MSASILSKPVEHIGKMRRLVEFQIKLWWHYGRLFRKNRAGTQAAALSYNTIFGLIPLAIVMLLIFQLLPNSKNIRDNIKDYVYEQAGFSAFEAEAQSAAVENGEQSTIELTDRLDEIVEGFFEGTKTKGSITIFSVLIVIWAAFALLSTIEKAFNNIWHVSRGRGFLHRMINYWAVLTLGPLIVGAGIYMATRFGGIKTLNPSVFSQIMPQLTSFLVATVAFFLLYFVLPNTKVNAGTAILGAAVAALVWVLAKKGYGICVTELNLYKTVYGALALIPITVMWIYISWVIVLFGLQLTFTMQHFKSLEAEIAAAKKRQEHFIANEYTAITIMREIVKVFESNEAPVESEVLLAKLDLPGGLGEKVLQMLVNCGMLARTTEPREGFVPAKDPVHIKLSDIAEAVADVSFESTDREMPESVKRVMLEQQQQLSQYTIRQMLDSGETTV